MAEVIDCVLAYLQVDSKEAAEQYSRWARMLIMLLITAQPDCALGIMQACHVVRTGEYGQDYPDEEVSWLFATAWQQGQDIMRRVAHRPR